MSEYSKIENIQKYKNSVYLHGSNNKMARTPIPIEGASFLLPKTSDEEEG